MQDTPGDPWLLAQVLAWDALPRGPGVGDRHGPEGRAKHLRMRERLAKHGLSKHGKQLPAFYHAPVFVLTHHSRGPLTMAGGTTFTFVTDDIKSALDQARKAAGDRDVAVAGGAARLTSTSPLASSTSSAPTSHRSPSARANASSTAYRR